MKEFEPNEVWSYFEDILKIPRVSKKEDKIIAYLEKFARKHKLDYEKDKAGNVVIRKPATPGIENRETMILQSHVDMVAEKLSGVKHDFNKDSIKAVEQHGWLTAEGTTLGADDGIGVAASLAILASDSISHGPIECLFTVDEETGMTGAFGLKKDFLKGKILLNLDSEDEGEIFIGCAGGIDTIGRFNVQRKRTKRKQVAHKIVVDGLKGGHSGDEIHKGFGNAIKILNRILWNADQRFKFYLSSIEGGKLRNAIPRQAEAVIVSDEQTAELMQVFFNSLVIRIRKEIETVEPELTMSMKKVKLPETRFKKGFQSAFMNMIYALPHGAMTWSRDIPDLVETSTNLAVIRQLKPELLEVVTSQRSSVETAKRDIADRIASVFRLASCDVIHSDGYPGWKPNKNSEILQISVKEYKKLFRKEPEVKAVHAGLECGLFLEKYPQLDMISFGPTIKGAHTPEEKININSVKRFWKFLLKLLEQAPVKKSED